MPTPEQYRKARHLLGWGPADVAVAAATTVAMVLRLENGFGVTPQVRASVNVAFAAHGIGLGRDGSVRLAGPVIAPAAGPALQLTGEQVRLARQLLGWRQPQLARAAGIGRSTVGSLEVGDRAKPATRAAVMRALKAAGVVVDAEGRVTLRGNGSRLPGADA